jgi:signal transduction histidine kinase/CheY-like chemotaxis protein
MATPREQSSTNMGGLSELTPPAPNAVTAHRTRAQAASHRLLVVAEDRTMAGLLKPLMQGNRLGSYTVEVVNDAAVASRLLKLRLFDVYLFDQAAFGLLTWLPPAEAAHIGRRSVVITALEAAGPEAMTAAICLPAARLNRFSLDHSLWQVVRHHAPGAVTSTPSQPAIFDVLLRLARLDLAHAELDRALHPLTEAAAEALRVGRVSVWALRDDPKRLVCLDMFLSAEHEHQPVGDVPATACPVYCMSLHNHRIMAVEDALGDARTAELADMYLRGAGIGALLDAPIYLDGEVAGLLCCAHVGGERAWSDEEQRLAASFADYAQIVLMAHKRRRAEEALSAQQAELAQAQKMEALGRLAGGIAHDFNNLLTVISGRAQMLQRAAAAPADDHVDPILSACDRAQAMIQQLLSFSRKDPAKAGWVNVHAVIADVCTMLEHTIDRRIAVRQEPGPMAAVVYGDGDEIQRALLNLGINARDAMPEGGAIVFRTRRHRFERAVCQQHPQLSVDGEYLEISVVDSGVGMSDEVQRHIFDPFFTTKAQGQGTGFGLANVAACVRAHNGHVEFTSAPGAGTTFRLYLPLSESGKAVGERPVAYDARVRRKGSILLIDDDSEVRSTVSSMLSFFGYDVHPCDNPFSGLKHFSEHRDSIDLVLLDMIMPEMSGRDCFRALRLIDRNVRCLLISGGAPDGTIEECLANGALGLIPKPCKMAAIAGAVAKAMDDRERDRIRRPPTVRIPT